MCLFFFWYWAIFSKSVVVYLFNSVVAVIAPFSLLGKQNYVTINLYFAIIVLNRTLKKTFLCIFDCI